nr:CHASE2 domain-containing protein [Methylocucumis oryzae]
MLALHLLVLQSYRTELQAVLAPHFPELARFVNAQTDSVNQRSTLENFTDQLLKAAVDKPTLFDDLARSLAQSAKTDATKALLSALFACYTQTDQITLNFYGPEHTINTVAYHDLSQVLTTQPNYLRDKIVVFGPSVDLGQEVKGGTIDNGFSLISSTELLATTIANLKAQKLLNRPDKIAIGISYSVLTISLLFLSMVCRPNKLLSYLALFGLGYFGLTLSLINYFNIWLPYLLILAQLTVIAFIHSAQQYANKRHQLSQIYQHKIPAPLLNDFNNGQSAQHEDGKRYTGISFATDGEGFTQLGASKGEQWLAQFMQAYQPMVERCIREHQGTVKDWAGDGMLAIWLDKQPPKTNTLHRQRPSQMTDKNLSNDIRHQALCAALALTRAVADFNQNYGVSFPIRIGINYGPFWLSFNQDLKSFWRYG